MLTPELMDMEATIHRVEDIAALVSLLSEGPEFEGEAELALNEVARNLRDAYAQLKIQWNLLAGI